MDILISHLRVVGLAFLGLSLFVLALQYAQQTQGPAAVSRFHRFLVYGMRVLAWLGIFILIFGEAYLVFDRKDGGPWPLWQAALRLLAYGLIFGGALALLLGDTASTGTDPSSRNSPKDPGEGLRHERRAVRISRGFWCILLGLVILALQLWNIAWCLALSLIPGAIVIQHALFLSLNKRQTLDPTTPEVQKVMAKWRSNNPLKATKQDPSDRGPVASFAYQQYFGPGVLVLRYGVPAILLTATCLTWTGVFFQGWFPLWPSVGLTGSHATEMAALTGLGGAFTYTVLNLGQRSSRGDLTSWVAYNCLATLISGPLLAIIAAMIVNNPEKVTTSLPFNVAAACFIAGYAPQPITQFLWGKVRRQLGGGEVPARLINNLELVCIRGITVEVAERLREEGIEDAFALAYAEPYHLFRNTGYSHQQILTWIDEALLYQFLPTPLAEKLVRDFGLTGAVDLGWHYMRYKSFYPHPDEHLAEGKPEQEIWLDKALNWDPRQMADLLNRIYFDPQVQMVAALYRLGIGTGDPGLEASVIPSGSVHFSRRKSDKTGAPDGGPTTPVLAPGGTTQLA